MYYDDFSMSLLYNLITFTKLHDWLESFSILHSLSLQPSGGVLWNQIYSPCFDKTVTPNIVCLNTTPDIAIIYIWYHSQYSSPNWSLITSGDLQSFRGVFKSRSLVLALYIQKKTQYKCCHYNTMYTGRLKREKSKEDASSNNISADLWGRRTGSIRTYSL